MSEEDMRDILAEEKIYFSDKQLDDISVKYLNKVVEFLGATAVLSKEEATIIIYNPGSPLHKPLSEATQDERPQMPYHWLSACRMQRKRVALEDLTPQKPFMQHADPTRRGIPVRIYVSKNIQRKPGQLQLAIWRVEGDRLAQVGATIVEKRHEADVLVVDRQSDFYQRTIKVEIEKYSRTHQRVAERPWIDRCIAEHAYLNVSAGELDDRQRRDQDGTAEMNQKRDAEEQQQQDAARRKQREDSFAEENLVLKPRGGPSVGTKRIEYTPEDDDFLCRYLAAFYPFGSWGSRKTFHNMMENEAKFPIIRRHTAQSWHERFKKNKMPFARRVERYVARHINDKLETADERRHVQEQHSPAQQRASLRVASISGSPLPSKQATPNLRAKRSLAILSGSDEEDGAKKRSAPVGRTARVDALGRAPDVTTAPTALTQAVVGSPHGAVERVPPPETPKAKADVPPQPTSEATPGAARPELTIVPPQRTAEGTSGTATMEPATMPAAESPTQLQTAPASGRGERIPVSPGMEAQSQQEEMDEATVERSIEVTVTAEGRNATVKEEVVEVAIVTAVATAASAATAEVPTSTSATNIPTSPAAGPSSAQIERDPAESSPSQRHPETQTTGTQSPSTQTMAVVSMPSTPDRPPPKLLPATEPVVRREPTMEEEIAQAQRRTEERQHKRRRTLDTVSATAAAPAPSPQLVIAPTPAAATSGPSSELRSRPARSPTLSATQQAERHAQSEAAARAARGLYRERITMYCKKYGVGISELGKTISEFMRGQAGARVGGEGYWKEVDDGLKLRFGF